MLFFPPPLPLPVIPLRVDRNTNVLSCIDGRIVSIVAFLPTL